MMIDPITLKKEKAKARDLRNSTWWKRKRSDGRCHYCQRVFKVAELTMDHVIPLSRGGRSVKDNLVPACKECNNAKKNLIPAEWGDYLDRLSGRPAAHDSSPTEPAPANAAQPEDTKKPADDS